MSKPNVLLFFTDQQRFDTIHALGNPVIRTPSLDRLVRSGVAFTSAYSPSPVCVSARCSLHYGQYPWTTNCYDNGYAMPEDGRPSFVDALARAGYLTHGIGKCHFTPDGKALRGFAKRETQDEIVRDPERDDYHRFLFENGFDHICDTHGVRGEMYYVPQVAQMPARLHPTQWIGDRSVAFVRERSGDDGPWFLFSSFIDPHPPFAPPAPWHKLYRAPLMPLPKVPADVESLYTYINRRQNRYKYRDQGIDNNLLRNMRAYYFACVSFIDYQVGRVLGALDETGQLDDTLVVYTSDHGEHLGDYHCFGKRSFHDTCARVPLLACMPGRFEGGLRCDVPASLVDVAPTVLAAAGVEDHGMQLDGVDLVNLVSPGEAAPDASDASGTSRRGEVFSQYQRAERAIYFAVNERFKYAYSAGDDKEFLFDRSQDPAETRNRAGAPFCGEHLKSMREAMVETLRRGGETSALDGDGWRKYPRQEAPDDPDTGLLIQDHPWAETDIPGYTD